MREMHAINKSTPEAESRTGEVNHRINPSTNEPINFSKKTFLSNLPQISGLRKS
jgi:hypothetical protein